MVAVVRLNQWVALTLGIMPITRPDIFGRMADHAGTYRVRLDIAMTCEQVIAHPELSKICIDLPKVFRCGDKFG